ncbi:uncharacterized protein MAM_05719 [Metarhizium album ARSEF 1941]|uniref:Mid2 domain-containing protein n=1 Tax=Metarhizium album (strain ARSEF 1941) TaxID=1081103 RepID=A0A0B2WU35_METAS|nr:uncharacterized protein MAM_05719 [Metarhizium album ARSEF 1941]KHN96430.1 hypothetical protein MAM_05719 [Metarhizium album ARSEF 1941]
MARLPPHLRRQLLAGVVSSNPTPALFARDTCAASGRTSCTSQGLSEGLCCPQNSQCVPLAGNTTVMCCPSDSSCAKIQPITCDVSEQDPTLHPDAPIKTVARGAKLPTCGGDFCCPFGYSCSADRSSCTKDSDQSKAPPGMTSTVTPAPTTTPGTSASTTAAAAAAATSTGASRDTGSSSLGPKEMSIIGGVAGGALTLVLMAMAGLVFLCIRSRSKKALPQRGPSRNGPASSGPYGNLISGPITNPDLSFRTDFIRQTKEAPPRVSVMHSLLDRCSRMLGVQGREAHNTRMSIPNRFGSPNPSLQSSRMSRSSLTSEDERNARTGHVGARLPPIRQLKGSSRLSCRISTHDFYRDSARDSIAFADPGAASQPHRGGNVQRGTTFSDLMNQVTVGDAHRNDGYVPGSQNLLVPGTKHSLR